MDVLPKARMLRLTVSTSGIRLDSYLTKTFPQFSRAYLQKLIEQGYILVNQRQAKASRKLAGEDRITIEFSPLPTLPKAESIPLNIIYEDNEIIVVDKPAGLTIHPAPWHPDHTLVNAILAHCPGLERSGGLVRPGIVHRLDKDTSGLIVVAKNESARVSLINQFKGKTVTKSYLVLVNGRVFPGRGTIELPIGRDPRNRKRMAIVEGGREAITHYQVNRYFGDYTLLEVMPKTGRTHQIRVHLATIGYPVVGDPVYGVKLAYLGRQFIHAQRLGFCSPSTNQYLEFSAPLPEELKQVLEMLPH